MKKEEILKKAIEKAKSNGWSGLWKDDRIKYDFKWETIVLTNDAEYSVNDIAFNKDFAKAFWGKEWDIPSKTGHRMIDGRNVIAEITKGKPWQYHLQQMVLEEDPVKYLEKFI